MPNWGGGASGAASGAALGSSFGPIGTGVGAVAGGLIGLFKKKPKPVTQASTTTLAPPPTSAQTQLTEQTPKLWENYNNAVTQNTGDYTNLQTKFNDFKAPTILGSDKVTAPTITPQTVNYSRSGDLQSAISGYKDFSTTGGFTPQAIQEMRARGISPIRAVYANAMQNMDRSRALQGGYSPNYIAATEKLTRTLPGVLADKVSDVNATLAQQIQQGRLAGLSGLSQASIADAELGQRAALANQSANLSGQTSNAGNILSAAGINNNATANLNNANLAASGQNLSALSGASSLYGTTPGQANMFGNQVLNATNQGNNYDIAQRELDLREKGMPTTFDKNLGRIGDIAKIAGGVIGPWLNGDGGGFFGTGDKNVNAPIYRPDQ